MGDIEHEPLLSSLENARHTPIVPEDHHAQTSQKGLEDAVLPETSTAGRRIGWTSAYILVISRVIGSGIFAMPGVIIQNVGSPGIALILWVAGAVVAWIGLGIDLEYGCMLPRSGGIKVYLEYTYPRPRFFASTMVAVQAVLLGFTASNCIVFAKYMMYATGAPADEWTTKTVAVSLLTAITIVHGCFFRTGIWIQNVLGYLKLALVAFTCLTGVAVLFRTSIKADDITDDSSEDFLWGGSNWEWSILSTAFFKVFYSYAGLGNLNNVLNEVKDPVRTLKTVAPAALFTACVMYILTNIAYLSVVPIDDIRQNRELVAAVFFDELGFGKWFLPTAIALSAAGNVMVVTFSLARLNQEVARQGFLPFNKLLSSNQPFGAPLGGLIIHYFPSVLVIVLPSATSVYAFIADTEGYAGQFYALAVAIGVLILRSRKPNLLRPYKAWIPGVWIRISLCVALILAPLFPPTAGHGDVDFFYATYAFVALGVLSFGVIYWALWIRVIPRLLGYTLVEEIETLPEDLTVTRLVKEES